MTVGPAKVKACKSILFTECIPEVEIENTSLMQLTHSKNDDKLPYLH